MNDKKSIVIKLGGTSQCKRGYDSLINYIKDKSLEYKIFIVLSAVSSVTNLLEKYTKTKDYTHICDVMDLNEKLIDELYPSNEYSSNPSKPIHLLQDFEYELKSIIELYNDLDDIISKGKIIGFGERMSTKIFNHYYLDSDSDSDSSTYLFNSYDYIKTSNKVFDLYPTVEFYCSDDIAKSEYGVSILQGFIASDINGNPTLLGRGGSDTTGALIAKTVNAERYEVWTDVDGIYTGDPRILNSAIPIKNISYVMCKEIAALGAKVMHPLSILPCQTLNIPIIVKSSFSNSSGTVISNKNDSNTIIAIQNDVTLFNIRSENMWNAYGFVSDIFRRFSELHIDINIITTSQFSISTTTNEKNKYLLNKVHELLKSNYDCTMTNSCTIISLISDNIYDKITKLNLDELKPEIIHIGSNNLSVNLVFKNKTRDEIKDIINMI
jgi:aspartate kinase